MNDKQKTLTLGGVGILLGTLFAIFNGMPGISLQASPNVVCAGNLEEPCIGLFNLTIQNESLKLAGVGLRINVPGAKEAWVEEWNGTAWTRTKDYLLNKGSTYQFRVVAYKNRITDDIKWSAYAGNVEIDPEFLGYSPNDFFTNLISAKADLTSGDLRFKIKNPTSFNITINESALNGIALSSFGKLSIKKFETFKVIPAGSRVEEREVWSMECTSKLSNGTASNCTRKITSYENVTVPVAEFFEPANMSLSPNEESEFVVRAYWNADVGSRGIDIAPTLKIGDSDVVQKEWVWMNNTWTRRSQVNVSQAYDSKAAGYPVLVNVTYATGMASDFSDLRFVNGSHNTLLSYWIESSVASSYANVWVLIDQSITTSNYSFWIYYGSASSSLSNGPATFPCFDDFNDGSINSTLWATVGGPTEAGGWLIVPTGSEKFAHTKTLCSYAQNYSVKMRLNATAVSVSYIAVGFWANGGDPSTYFTRATSSQKVRVGSTNYAVTNNLGASFQDMELVKNSSTNVLYYYNEVLDTTIAATTATKQNVTVYEWTTSGPTIYIDWMFVRPYQAPEPVVQIESVQILSNVTLNTPVTNANATSSSVTFNYTPNSTISTSFSNATLWGNFTGTWAANTTNASTVTNGSLNSLVNAYVPAGYFVWNVLVCDSVGACFFAPSNYSINGLNLSFTLAQSTGVSSTIGCSGTGLINSFTQPSGQTNTIGLFNFTNTGTTSADYQVKLPYALQAGYTLFLNSSTVPAGVNLTTSWQNVSTNKAGNYESSYVWLWLWCINAAGNLTSLNLDVQALATGSG